MKIFGFNLIKENDFNKLNEEVSLLKEAITTYRKERDKGWQVVGENNIDFPKETDDKIRKLARESFYVSPAGKRMVKYVTSYITGKNFFIDSSNEAVNYIIRDFISEPKNDWLIQTKEWSNNLQVDGEVFLTLFIGKNGKTLIRDIDPHEITDILTHPEDKRTPVLYKRDYEKVHYESGEQQTTSETEYIPSLTATNEDIALMNLPEDAKVTLEEHGSKQDKRLFHVKTITLSQKKRGLSDFSAILYYLSRSRMTIDNHLVVSKLKKAFFMDVEVDGSPEEVAVEEGKSQYQRPPKVASTLFHNSKVKVDIKQPSMNAGELEKEIKPINQQIVIGSGMPEWMLMGQANMYKAGAQEQSAPFVKLIEDYQEQWGDVYTKVLTFVIKNVLDKNKDREQLDNTPGFKGLLAQIDKNYMIEEMTINEEGKRIQKTNDNGEVIKKPFWEAIQVTFPEIIARDEKNESDAVTSDIANKLCSRKTASITRGYDYEQEKILMDLEQKEDDNRNPFLKQEDNQKTNNDIDNDEDNNNDNSDSKIK